MEGKDPGGVLMRARVSEKTAPFVPDPPEITIEEMVILGCAVVLFVVFTTMHLYGQYVMA